MTENNLKLCQISQKTEKSFIRLPDRKQWLNTDLNESWYYPKKDYVPLKG